MNIHFPSSRYFYCSLIGVLTLATFTLHLQASSTTDFEKKFAALEASVHGRLGVCALDTSNNKSLCYRAEERFHFFCTAKVLGVAAILKKSMSDPQLMQQRVMYTKEDLISWSPITEKHLTDGMTVSELCGAALMYSDNAAINLLMKQLGGPEGVTAFARSIGDNSFQCEHWWVSHLVSDPNNPADTTTPAAMAKSLQELALKAVLGQAQRDQLILWMKLNTTGYHRIRAGVPLGCAVADKTGTGDYGITNDIGVLWPLNGGPIVLAIYFSGNKKENKTREDVVASATQIVMQELGKTKK